MPVGNAIAHLGCSRVSLSSSILFGACSRHSPPRTGRLLQRLIPDMLHVYAAHCSPRSTNKFADVSRRQRLVPFPVDLLRQRLRRKTEWLRARPLAPTRTDQRPQMGTDLPGVIDPHLDGVRATWPLPAQPS